MQRKMTDHLKAFFLNHLALPEDVPEQYRRSVMRDRQMLQFSFRLKDGLLEQVQHSIFYDDKVLPIVAKVSIETPLNYEQNLKNIILLSSMISGNEPNKNANPPLSEKQKIDELCESILRDVTFSEIKFEKKGDICKCDVEKCEHYYLFHMVLRDYLSQTWSSLFFIMLLGVMETFYKKMNEDLRNKFHELSAMDIHSLPRNVSEPIKQKKDSQFFGTAQDEMDYVLDAHKEIYASLSNIAQTESMYDAQCIQKSNTLEEWLKVLTKRNGRKDWVKHLYK